MGAPASTRPTGARDSPPEPHLQVAAGTGGWGRFLEAPGLPRTRLASATGCAGVQAGEGAELDVAQAKAMPSRPTDCRLGVGPDGAGAYQAGWAGIGGQPDRRGAAGLDGYYCSSVLL